MSSYDLKEELKDFFSDEEMEKIEGFRNDSRLRSRHPLVSLFYSSSSDRFESQHRANLIRCIRSILEHDSKWILSAKVRKRLISPQISTSSGVLGEIKAYGYILSAFPDSQAIPEGVQKSPDFKVVNQVNNSDKPVYVEVHSMAWSGRMSDDLDKFERAFVEGNIGTEIKHENGSVRTASTIITPFSGTKRDTTTEDAVSKIASIGTKSAQIPKDTHGVLWLNFEQSDWLLSLTVDDLHPLYSKHGGDVNSGKIWSALYGRKSLPLYEVFPDRGILTMKHDGLFAQHRAISAVIVNFGRAIVLLESDTTENILPDWFRVQCFNFSWFCLHHSEIRIPGTSFKKIIASKRQKCRGLKSFQIIENW